MLRNPAFYVGIVVGIGGLAIYHRWVKPMPTTAG